MIDNTQEQEVNLAIRREVIQQRERAHSLIGLLEYECLGFFGKIWYKLNKFKKNVKANRVLGKGKK